MMQLSLPETDGGGAILIRIVSIPVPLRDKEVQSFFSFGFGSFN